MLCYIILNYNDSKTTKNCVESIRNFNSIDHIIIVDNSSTDDSYEKLLLLIDSKVDVIRTSHNGGYGSGNNYGVLYAKEKYNPDLIVISNPDVLIQEDSVIECMNFLLSHQDATIAVPLMLDNEENPCFNCVWKVPTYIQYLLFSLYVCGKFVKSNNYSKDLFDQSKPFKCDCVAGSWLMSKTECFIQSGMYDESIFLYCEETVLGIRMKRLEYNCYVIPYISFIHKHSVSVNKTIKSKYQQQKLMWKSRKYVLDNYYKRGLMFRILTSVIQFIGLFEYKLRTLYHTKLLHR